MRTRRTSRMAVREEASDLAVVPSGDWLAMTRIMRETLSYVQGRARTEPLTRRYTVAEALYRIGIGYVPHELDRASARERRGAISRSVFDELVAAPDGVGAELRAQRGTGGIRVTEREILRWEAGRQQVSDLVAIGRRNQHTPMKQRRPAANSGSEATRTRRTRAVEQVPADENTAPAQSAP